MMMGNRIHQCRRELPSLGNARTHFRVIYFSVCGEIHIDDHFPDIMQQSGHEADVLILDPGSFCDQRGCGGRPERVFPELRAILSAAADRSADEHAQGQLLQHIHANENHRMFDRADLGAMAVISRICQGQYPCRQSLITRHDRGEFFRAGGVVIRQFHHFLSDNGQRREVANRIDLSFAIEYGAHSCGFPTVFVSEGPARNFSLCYDRKFLCCKRFFPSGSAASTTGSSTAASVTPARLWAGVWSSLAIIINEMRSSSLPMSGEIPSSWHSGRQAEKRPNTSFFAACTSWRRVPTSSAPIIKRSFFRI